MILAANNIIVKSKFNRWKFLVNSPTLNNNEDKIYFLTDGKFDFIVYLKILLFILSKVFYLKFNLKNLKNSKYNDF